MKLKLSLCLFLLFVFPTSLLAKCVEGDCQNGVGTYNYYIGKIYKGEWKNGNKHGQGIYTYPDGKKYVGEFKDGKKHGYGIEKYPNGSKYDGDFRKGKPNGQGTFTGSDGKIFTGEFKNGNPVGKNSAAPSLQNEQDDEEIVNATSKSAATTFETENIDRLKQKLSLPAESVTVIAEIKDVNTFAITKGDIPVGKPSMAEAADDPGKVQHTAEVTDKLQPRTTSSIKSAVEADEKQVQALADETAIPVAKEKDDTVKKRAAIPAKTVQPVYDAENAKSDEVKINTPGDVQAAANNQEDVKPAALANPVGSVSEIQETGMAESELTVDTIAIDETIKVQANQIAAANQSGQINREKMEQPAPVTTADATSKIDVPGEIKVSEGGQMQILTIPDMHNPDAVANNRIPDGQGVKIFPDGSKYTGEFKNGMPNGQGVTTTLFGKKYVGDFVNGFPHGQGIFTSPDGEQYVGEFKFGIPHGQGTYTYFDGERYTGDLQNGIKNGQGSSTFPDGSKYIGGWKDGEFHGRGTYTNPEGLKYSGEWKNGRQYGQGTLMLPDGEKYTGEFKKGKPDGFGTLTSANGEQFTGEFKMGQPLGSD